jgi:hypothetical protein
MDQIQRDKIAAKLKKIKALAERGVGGEKETAMRMYEDLKARYDAGRSDASLVRICRRIGRKGAALDFLQGDR